MHLPVISDLPIGTKFWPPWRMMAKVATIGKCFKIPMIFTGRFFLQIIGFDIIANLQANALDHLYNQGNYRF